MRPPRQLLSLSFALLFVFSVTKISPALAQISGPGQGSSTNPAAAAPLNSLPKEWTEAIRSLARKIKEAMGGSRALALEFQNISSLSDANASGIEGALKEDLSREHLEVTDAPKEETAKVRVTLSENAAERVWTAEFEQAATSKVVMVSVERFLTAEPGLAPAPVLQRKIVFQQAAPILDFEVEEALPNSGSNLEFRDVLTPTGLFRYQFQANHLQTELADFGPVRITARNSRDLRGRILGNGSQDIRFFIGGSLCVAGPVSTCNENSTLGWPINPSGTNWAAVYDASRNYFKAGGVYSGEVRAELPAFYSAAVFDFGQGTAFVLTGLDGRAQVFTSTIPPATYTGWGDDIVSLGQGCDSHQEALVTGTGDWTQPDHLQLYEITGNQAAAVGQPLQFSGPITALWPSNDGKSARVVSRDLATGMYEGSIVTVVCNN
jgi:hypothetical protein